STSSTARRSRAVGCGSRACDEARWGAPPRAKRPSSGAASSWEEAARELGPADPVERFDHRGGAQVDIVLVRASPRSVEGPAQDFTQALIDLVERPHVV